jgi:hypothetical protein
MSRYEPKTFKEAITTWLIGMLVLSPFLWLVCKFGLQIGDNYRQQTREYYTPAVQDYQQGNYVACENLVNTYLNLQSRNPYGNYLLALCQLRRGYSGQSEVEFRECTYHCLDSFSARSPTSSDNAHLLHDDAQQMIYWIQQNPGNTTPPANAEDFTLLQSIEQ